MKNLDNILNTVRDDLQETIKKGSKVSIAAACFSIYVMEKQMSQIRHCHVLMTEI